MAGDDMPHAPVPATGGFIDPVCGMTVHPARAAGRTDYQGKTYYFCAKSCLAKFEADPQRYLAPRPPQQLLQIGKRPAPVHPQAHDDLHQEVAQGAGAGSQPLATYVCPMDPEVRQPHPGACPKCGMALEPDLSTTPLMRVEYTCPMHPEVSAMRPGRARSAGWRSSRAPLAWRMDPTPNWWTWAGGSDRRALGAPVFLLAMGDMLPGPGLGARVDIGWTNWLELALATPVVWWAGWPFFERGWASIVNRSPNMFTLIALGIGAA